MIDMDDVIVKGGFLYLINEFLGSNYNEDDFKSFYMQDILPDKDKFFKYFITKNMYNYSTINKDAYEVIKKLNENYKVYIGTSYIFPEIVNNCGIILLQKYDYLLKEFPYLKPENLVFLVDKSVLNCEIKIDDKIENLNGAEIKILYTAYHNKDINDDELKEKGIIRANNWLDIKNILLNNS